MKELCIQFEDELYRYLDFLEKVKLIKSKEEAVTIAVSIFKKLNMQDWLPYVYRAGPERILLMGQGMVNDVFNTMTESQIYDAARITALKRRILNPFDPDLDLTEQRNWGVVLNELQNFGWGKFTLDEEEVMVEFLGVPIIFLKGYLETLFKVEFSTNRMKTADIYVLKKEKTKNEVWF